MMPFDDRCRPLPELCNLWSSKMYTRLVSIGSKEIIGNSCRFTLTSPWSGQGRWRACRCAPLEDRGVAKSLGEYVPEWVCGRLWGGATWRCQVITDLGTVESNTVGHFLFFPFHSRKVRATSSHPDPFQVTAWAPKMEVMQIRLFTFGYNTCECVIRETKYIWTSSSCCTLSLK